MDTIKSICYVDVPDPNKIGNPEKYGDEIWTNVGEFKNKKEAIRWIRKHIGMCDSMGRIRIIVR